MTVELVHRCVSNGIAFITLDSPHNRNALSFQLRAELLQHFEAAEDNDDVRVIVLTHEGPAFCSGADLKEATTQGVSGPGVVELTTILEKIWTSSKPVVARITGPARAGGLGLIAACDVTIAADTVSFALSEVRIGVVAAVISATILPRVQASQIHELFLTGETFDAARAKQIGLINCAVAPDSVDAEVRRYTEMLALGGPKALAATKQMLRMQRPDTLASELEQLRELSVSFFASKEGREGMRAFIEKRPAAWVPTDPVVTTGGES